MMKFVVLAVFMVALAVATHVGPGYIDNIDEDDFSNEGRKRDFQDEEAEMEDASVFVPNLVKAFNDLQKMTKDLLKDKGEQNKKPVESGQSENSMDRYSHIGRKRDFRDLEDDFSNEDRKRDFQDEEDDFSNEDRKRDFQDEEDFRRKGTEAPQAMGRYSHVGRKRKIMDLGGKYGHIGRK